MAKPARFTPKSTPSGWCLNVPAKFSKSGKRERHFFRTRALADDAAKKFRDERDEFGAQAKAIAPSLAEEATAAAELLKPFGVSVLEAARIVAEQRRREAASYPADAAAEEWLASCDDLRSRTVQGYRHIAGKLKAGLGCALLATVDAEALHAALAPAGTPAIAAASYLRRGKVFWNWCAKRGWCDASLAEKLEMPKQRESREIEILTPAEAEALLRAAEAHFPQAVASYALQLFAGIRAEEVVRLESHHVTLEGIDLPASVTKKGRRRHITPSPALASWLEAYPFEPCPNWKRVNDACRRLAGWDVTAEILTKPPEPTRGAWPQNALRHSHASYAVAAGVSLESLLFEFGHSYTMTFPYFVGSLRFLAPDVFAYGIAPPDFTCWFPYVSAPWNTIRVSTPGWLPLNWPADHFSIEPSIGLLVATPFVALAGVAGVVAIGRVRLTSASLSAIGWINWLWVALVVWVLGAAPMWILNVTTMRYQQDFASALLLLAIFGGWRLLAAPQSRRGRLAMAWVYGGLAVVTIVAGVLLGFTGYFKHFIDDLIEVVRRYVTRETQSPHIIKRVVAGQLAMNNVILGHVAD